MPSFYATKAKAAEKPRTGKTGGLFLCCSFVRRRRTGRSGFFDIRTGEQVLLYERMNSDRIPLKEGDSIDRRTKQDLWRRTQAKQYTLRIVHDSGIPKAIEQAAAKAGETQSQYIKNSIVMRLQDEGFLSGNVVVNRTQQRHKEKIERLKEYIAAEESKNK